MGKYGVFLGLLAMALLAAGLFGALHNQLSYSVGPDYYHAHKFDQFGIAEAQRNRIGAALVGWQASWWMGVIIGLPAFALGLFSIARPQTYLAAGIGAIGAVLMVTLMASLAGLAIGMIWVDGGIAQSIPVPDGVTDPTGYVRAGLMHDLSYMGGLAGMLVALWTMWRARKYETRHFEERRHAA